jgi:hypothetical protein
MAQANRRAEQRAEGWAGAAQDVANDAAHTEPGEVGPGVIVAGRRSTGQGEWGEDLRAFMRERPLTGAALMIAAGYMAAKFLRR